MGDRVATTANSRNGLEAGLAGMEATNGVAMMFGVHGAKEVGGGFVFWSFLLAAPMHAQTVAKAPEQAHDAHGAGMANAALIIQMGDVQSLVQAAFDAPGRPVVFEPLAGVQCFGRKACHQGDRLGAMVAQVAAEQRHLLHARKADLLGTGRARAQGACFKLAFVELTAARQGGRGILREKKWPAARRPVFQCWRARWAGCL